jgi:hypothetical protein
MLFLMIELEKDSVSGFGFWRKIAVCILLLCIFDSFVALFLRIRLTDLLFVEGMLVFAAGAFVAAGMANPRRETWITLTADPEGYRKFLEEQRSKQVSDGIVLMIIGVVIIGLSLVIGMSDFRF